MMKTLFLLLTALVFLTENAYAYIDPGTGGMILQAIAAAVVSGMVAVRLYWAKLRDFFKPKNQKK